MPKRTPTNAINHLRAWREFRGMTQEELAAAVVTPTSHAVISLLESGKRQLSLKWLNRLADALGTKPGMLIDHAPEDLDTSILELWAMIPETKRDDAAEVLKAFARNKKIG